MLFGSGREYALGFEVVYWLDDVVGREYGVLNIGMLGCGRRR